jgi:general secretion pathway protein M
MTLNLAAFKRPEHLWLLAAGLLALLALALMGLKVFSVHGNASRALAEVQPRHARIAGLLQSTEQLAQSARDLQANLADYVYPPDGDPGQIGNQALQQVRDIATGHGLRVTSSQVAAVREDRGFDHIGLSLRIEGDWPQQLAFMRDLARQRPTIYSETVQFGAQGNFAQSRLSATVVSVQFSLYALKERKP